MLITREPDEITVPSIGALKVPTRAAKESKISGLMKDFGFWLSPISKVTSPKGDYKKKKKLA